MNIEFINLKSYLESRERNIFIDAFWYSVIIGVLLILVVLFSSLKKKDVYYENTLYVENNEVILIVDYEKLELITNNREIIINERSYYYQVKDISILSDNNLYYQIKILIDNYQNNFNNVILKYKILLREENILKYIVSVIKGEEK